MSRRPPFDTRLLGGLTPDAFLASHWQRRPLLVRGAVPVLPQLPDRSGLAALAARDDVESRLVSVHDGHWSMEPGPFDRLPKARKHWTLLVQGVNLHDRVADALMRRFDFVSAMRLDDLMISYAVDGGSVGPHLDSYDVFLLQVEGRRRWRWRDRASATPRERALVDGAPLKLLKHFVPTDEAVLEPGDMLYLPPSCAHEGVAVGPCTTASIGFRAPSWNELSQEFLFAMAERDWPDGRHGDAGRKATGTPGAIDDAMLAAIADRIGRIRWTARDVEAFVGRHFSEPKPHVWFDPPESMTRTAFARRAARRGLALDLRTTLLHRGGRGYVAGEAFDLPAAARASIRRLADRRSIGAGATAVLMKDPAAVALLHAWWGHGWIHFNERDDDGAS
ncbi:MAG: cupin domain-containing protein [Burkholderiaceae bacterium]